MLPPLHPAFVRNVVYPVYRGSRGDRVLELLAGMERNQWLTPEEVEDLQWRLLLRLIEHIHAHVPYYGDLFAGHGLRVNEIQNPVDFRKVPMLTREIVHTQGACLTSRDPFTVGYASTVSGPAGDPIRFSCDRAAGPVRRANTLRGYRWAGVDVGGRQAIFRGAQYGASWRVRFFDAMKSYFNNVMYLSSSDLSAAALRRHAVRIQRYRPDLIVGYPSGLALFAEFCKNRGERIPPAKAILTSGERLQPDHRTVIESVLSSPVFERYGRPEFAGLAHECAEHNGLHVFSDLFFVEVITGSGRPALPGEAGEVVVTDLFNLYMPFLRYRTGDFAVLAGRSCTCGRHLPLLERIDGVMPGRPGFSSSMCSRYSPGS